MIEKVYFANLVELVRERGVWAEIRMAGGISTILAGAEHIDFYGNKAREAFAGPGDWRSDDLSVGELAELQIGADDFCTTLPIECSTLTITALGQIADLIVAQTQLPYGQALTPADAELVLQGQPVPGRPDAAMACSPTCHCRQTGDGKD
ncbi:hypothetical protein ACXJJ3_42175 (plasmid) [Kribbella sp. WER1]